ncbi:MAG: hypothetical protein ACI4W2_00675, partial [Eubacterium sp.]
MSETMQENRLQHQSGAGAFPHADYMPMSRSGEKEKNDAAACGSDVPQKNQAAPESSAGSGQNAGTKIPEGVSEEEISEALMEIAHSHP